ncbi:MAG TPA: hypothetical protein VN673_11525 [Clostridia bacterium]|nr:hypothetical protein [Clostridia bacterium]
MFERDCPAVQGSAAGPDARQRGVSQGIAGTDQRWPENDYKTTENLYLQAPAKLVYPAVIHDETKLCTNSDEEFCCNF